MAVGSGAVELGVGYVTVLPSARNFSKELDKQLAGASAGASRAGEAVGSRVASGMGKALKVGGIAAGAVLATSLTMGFRRLTAIEDAEAKLKGLGNSAADTAKIMENALAAVKGTAFGMDEAATTAASAVAAGLKPGKELQGYLGLVGDAATIAGTSMADMGSIFNKVMTSGKVQGDVFAQLGDQGIPVVQMLSETLGVSADEVYKLGSAGKISSDQFLQAMSSMEGAALQGGNTTTGAFKNMNAALSRLGASLLGGVFPHFKTSLNEMTGWIDGLESKLAPLADVVGQKLGTAFGAVVGWLQQLDLSSWSDFTRSMGASNAFSSIKQSLVELQPAFAAMREALPAIGSAAVKLGSGALTVLASVLAFLARNVDTIIKFMPALLAGYVAWRVASTALVASQTRLQLAQTMMAPVFLASNILRWQAVRGELALAAAKGTSTAATTTNTGATVANTAATNTGVLARGRAVVGIVAHRVATLASAAAAKAAAAAQWVWNAALTANPIGLVVAAVAALAVGLTYFFTKTETGKRIWESFMGVLGKAKDFFVDIIDFGKMVVDILFGGDFKGSAPFGLEEDSGLVDFLFRVRDAVMQVGQFLKDVAGFGKMVTDILFRGDFSGAPFGIEEDSGLVDFLFTVREAVVAMGGVLRTVFASIVSNWQWVLAVVFGPLGALVAVTITHWGTLKAGIQAVWTAIAATVQWVWSAIILPIWNAMTAAFRGVGAMFAAVWNSVIKPVWTALGAGIAAVWNGVVRPAWDALRAALGVVGSAFQTAWNSVIKPAWDALGNGIRAVVNGVVLPAWAVMRSGLDTIKGHFDTAVSAIKSVWESLSGALRKPIDFLVNVVWNRGLVPAWNTVRRFLPSLPQASPMPGFAVGGAVHGPGTGTSDSIVARLSRGEHVLTAAEVKAFGGHDKVYAMREMVRKGIFPAGHGVGMPAFRRGGEVDDTPKGGVRLSPTSGEGGLKPIAILAKRLIHRIWPSITTIGGYRQDAYPEHPSGRALDVMVGVGNPIGDEVTSWALANDAIMPLIHALWKQTVWMPNGSTQAMGDRGSPTQNHMDHPHLWYNHKSIDPNVIPEGLVGHDGLTAADRMGVIKDKIKEILDKALDPIKDGMTAAIGSPPPPYLDIPPQALTTTKDTAVDRAFEFVENIGDGLKEIYNVAKGVTAGVTGLFRDKGGFLPAGKSIVNNETGKPEAVLNWKQLEQVIRLMESASGLAALEAWANGDASKAIAEGVSEETVKAITEMGEHIAAEIAVMSEAFEKTWRDGMLQDALGVFGVGQIGGAAGAVMAALADPDLLKPKTDESTTGTVAKSSTALPGATDFGYENKTVELETRMPDMDTSSPGSGPVKDQVREAFAAYGWDKGEYWAATDWIVGKESTWDPMARNPSSGAFGLFQFLGGTKQQYLPDENPNPKVQGAAGAKYIKDRYGDPLKAKAFWERNGWYDQGGWLKPGITLTRNDTGKPEAVLNPAQWSMISRQIDVVEQMANGASGATYNVYANDLDEAMKRLRLREAQRAQTYMGAR